LTPRASSGPDRGGPSRRLRLRLRRHHGPLDGCGRRGELLHRDDARRRFGPLHRAPAHGPDPACRADGSAKVVGVTDITFLGYQDGELTVTHELRRDISRVIRQKRPDAWCPVPGAQLDPAVRLAPRPPGRAEAAICAVYPIPAIPSPTWSCSSTRGWSRTPSESSGSWAAPSGSTCGRTSPPPPTASSRRCAATDPSTRSGRRWRSGCEPGSAAGPRCRFARRVGRGLLPVGTG